METEVIAAIVGGLIAIAGTASSYLYRGYHEKMVVNKAILAEVSRLLIVLNSHTVFWKHCIDSNKTNHFPLIPFTTDVYKQHVNKIGVINQLIIAHAVKFYGDVEFINALQKQRGNYGNPLEFNCQYLNTLKTIVADYSKVFDAAFKKYGIL